MLVRFYSTCCIPVVSRLLLPLLSARDCLFTYCLYIANTLYIAHFAITPLTLHRWYMHFIRCISSCVFCISSFNHALKQIYLHFIEKIWKLLRCGRIIVSLEATNVLYILTYYRASQRVSYILSRYTGLLSLLHNSSLLLVVLHHTVYPSSIVLVDWFKGKA